MTPRLIVQDGVVYRVRAAAWKRYLHRRARGEEATVEGKRVGELHADIAEITPEEATRRYLHLVELELAAQPQT